MKKIVSLLLAAIMMVACASTALASISAYWADGQLTITTTDDGVAGINEISIDGVSTGKTVGGVVSSTLTISYPADNATHLVTAAGKGAATGGSATFYAGVPEAEPTEVPAQPTEVPAQPTEPPVEPTEPPVEPTEPPVEPTEPPVEPTEPPVEPTEPPVQPTTPPVMPTEAPEVKDGPLEIVDITYKLGSIVFTVKNVGEVIVEMYVDGESTGRTFTKSGQKSYAIQLKPGQHRLTIHGGAETDTAYFEVVAKIPVIESAEYTAPGVVTYVVSNLNGVTEVWVDGENSGYIDSGDGTYVLNKAIEEGKEHRIMLHDAVYGKNSNTVYFTATHIHTEVVDAAVPATCTEAGKTEGKHCSVCNEIIVAQEEVPALGHDLVDDEGSEATCTEAGMTGGKHCTRCDYVEGGEEIPALGHDLVDEEAVEPTCTEAGKTAGKHCTRCDYVEGCEEIPAKGHTIVIDKGRDALCDDYGLTEGKHCSVCGEVLVAQVRIEAFGHWMDIYSVDEKAITYKCVRCSYTQTKPNNTTKENGEGDILYDANMEAVPYYTYDDQALIKDVKLFVIKANLADREGKPSEIGLYITREFIDALIAERYVAINYINDTASLIITLKDIADSWFETEDAIEQYVFITDPKAEGGVKIEVCAKLAAGTMVEAKGFTGITLKGTSDIAVRENGVINPNQNAGRRR